jgi:hypothetical protein
VASKVPAKVVAPVAIWSKMKVTALRESPAGTASVVRAVMPMTARSPASKGSIAAFRSRTPKSTPRQVHSGRVPGAISMSSAMASTTIAGSVGIGGSAKRPSKAAPMPVYASRTAAG